MKNFLCCVNLWFIFCEKKIMQVNRVGIRVSIFCLTFLFGFLTVEWFISDDDKLTSNQVEQRNVLKINKTFRIVEFEQTPAKPPCRKFSNRSEFNELVKELDGINKRLL